MRRQFSLVLTFRTYEVEELDELIQMNWGEFPRGRVINEAVAYLLHHATDEDFRKCKIRRVNVLMDPDRFSKLNECAKAHGLKRTDLIRYAIHKVVPMYASGEVLKGLWPNSTSNKT